MSNETTKQPFKSKIGGQALIEGIMMRGIDISAMACRLPDGTIDVETWQIRNGKSAPWFLKVPFIRGAFNFAISLYDGMKCTIKSAQKQITDEDEEEEINPEEMSKFELWLSSKFEGEHGTELLNTIMIVFCLIFSAIAVCIFKFVPIGLGYLLNFVGAPDWVKTISEGVFKLALLIGYMWGISHMKDIHVTFMYHGAEHKSIACYENGLELTVENIRKQTRFHPRCGTSFLLLVILVSICVGMFLPWSNIWIRFGLQLLFLPIEASIVYEIIKIAGRYDNIFTRIISAPGLWLQRITTQEPTDAMIEVAIAALTPCLPKDKEDDKW